MLLLLIIFVAIHLLITISFTLAVSTWKSQSNTQLPSISIIIAARNEADQLRSLIPALVSQQYPDFEIVIGLDRCEDESVEYLEIYPETSLRWIDIQQVPAGWNAKKHALNTAIESSKGQWLVFTDADCVPDSKEWLRSLAREMTTQTNVVLGVSPYPAKRSFLSHFIQFEGFMTYFLYTGFTRLKRPYMGVGRNMAVRKSYFLELHGYEDIKQIQGGDDDLFIQKADKRGIALALGKNSLVNTMPSASMTAYKKQKIRHLSVGSYYSWLDSTLLSTYHFIHLTLIVLTILNFGNTFLLPTILFYLFIKFVSYRFVASKIGAGFNYILLPIVDTLYACMIPIIGIWSKFIKDIEWKN